MPDFTAAGGGSLKVKLVIDGDTRSVEVDLALWTARFAGVTHPIRLLVSSGSRVELDIDGERLVVGDWPIDPPAPPERVTVDGERYRLVVEVARGDELGRARTSGAASPIPTSPATEPAGPHVVVPPIPGKVIEVRVREGDRVEVGDVLLVLEAMKMRNEVTSPRAGVVRDLRVTAGSNVRAREAMLSVVPEGS